MGEKDRHAPHTMIRCPKDVYERLKASAAKYDRTISQQLTVALEIGLGVLERTPLPVASAEEPVPEVPKRPVGRPRKPQAEPEQPRRPRGRPRKPTQEKGE